MFVILFIILIVFRKPYTLETKIVVFTLKYFKVEREIVRKYIQIQRCSKA